MFKVTNEKTRTRCEIWSKLNLKKQLYGPFLRTELNCLRALEPLRGDSLLFTTQFQEIPGTQLIDIGRMTG